jgi:divalent metal cation (Fe/Co/Zn/Cd) transporter
LDPGDSGEHSFSSSKGEENVSIGASLVLIAVGAILRYAVTDHISGVDLTTVGLILLIVGIVGLVLSLIMYMSATRTRGGVVERTEYRAGDPTDPRY